MFGLLLAGAVRGGRGYRGAGSQVKYDGGREACSRPPCSLLLCSFLISCDTRIRTALSSLIPLQTRDEIIGRAPCDTYHLHELELA